MSPYHRSAPARRSCPNLTDDQRAINADGLAADESKLAKRERAQKGRVAGGKATPEQITKRQDRLATDVSAKRSQTKGRTPRSIEKAARWACVSERKVRQAAFVRKHRPDLVPKVTDGEMTLADAVREIRRAEATEGYCRSRLLILLAMWEKGQAIAAAFTGVETAPTYRQLSRETGRDDKALKKWHKLFQKYPTREKYLPVAQEWENGWAVAGEFRG